MVIQRQKSTLLSYKMRLEKSKSLYNVEMTTVFQRRNNVSSLTLNQRQNLMLKQRSFWVDSKTQFCSDITMLEKSKLCINVKKRIILQCRNNDTLLTLKQRRNLTLQQH